MSNYRRFKKPLIMAAVVIGMLTLMLPGLYGAIQWDAHTKADAIWKTHYPEAQDKVQAVILRVQDTHCTLGERNRAVWILGRLADLRALPVLEKAYTGGTCDHERALCQYELRKAILRCGGTAKAGTDLTVINSGQTRSERQRNRN